MAKIEIKIEIHRLKVIMRFGQGLGEHHDYTISSLFISFMKTDR